MENKFRGSRRGISLIELMVCCFLLVLLFYHVYQLLAPGLRAWHVSDEKIRLQQASLVALHRLMGEIQESNRNTFDVRSYDVTLYHVSTLVCFATSSDETGNRITRLVDDGLHPKFDSGEPVWQRYIIYYLDYLSRLRRIDTIDFTTNREAGGMQVSGDPVKRIHVSDLITDRIVAKDISTFTITMLPDKAHWNGWLHILVSARDNGNHQLDGYSSTLQTTLEVRYDSVEK